MAPSRGPDRARGARVYSDESYGKNLPEVREGITKLARNLTDAVKKGE